MKLCATRHNETACGHWECLRVGIALRNPPHQIKCQIIRRERIIIGGFVRVGMEARPLRVGVCQRIVGVRGGAACGRETASRLNVLRT